MTLQVLSFCLINNSPDRCEISLDSRETINLIIQVNRTN